MRSNQTRDSGDAKRLWLGCTSRLQKNDKIFNDEKRFLKNVRKGIPIPSRTFEVEGMSNVAKKLLGFSLELGTSLTKKFYQEENPFTYRDSNDNDDTTKIQRSLFVSEMNKIFDSPSSEYEFADIFVENGSTLMKHVDGKNDWRPGYNFGSSYSYLYTHNNQQFQVNVIATTRSTCGSCIKSFQNVAKETKMSLKDFIKHKLEVDKNMQLLKNCCKSLQ